MNTTFRKLYDMNQRAYMKNRTEIMSSLDTLEKLDIAGDYILQAQRIVLLIENALRTSKIKEVYDLTDRLYFELKEDYDKITEQQTNYLDDMEDYMKSSKTPCEYQDYEGNYSCPYDSQGGDDCRNYCGLGVDE